jgi:hypothetical protein
MNGYTTKTDGSRIEQTTAQQEAEALLRGFLVPAVQIAASQQACYVLHAAIAQAT